MIKDQSTPGFSGSVLVEKLAPFRPETKSALCVRIRRRFG
jgi:hypothetical protein